METHHPSPRPFALPALRAAWLVAIALTLGACAATTAPPGDRQPVDPSSECETFLDCDEGLVCRTVGAFTRCVFPELTTPDQTQCGECPYPSNCVGPVCVPPDMSGESCEFDTGCAQYDLCISGYCTPDPRRVPCSRDEQCFTGLACNNDGFCGVPHCESNFDCNDQFECIDGACTAPTSGMCSIVPPNFSGSWNTESELNVREALPSGVASVLDVVSGPFRFLSGETTTLETDFPDWVDDIIRAELQRYVDEDIPDWARDVMGAIAALNDVLSTWKTQEVLTFEHIEGADDTHYAATTQWLAIEFVYNGVRLHASPSDVEGWRFSSSSFNAHAECFDFVLEEHDVNVSIGAVVGWLVDHLVALVTHGRHNSLGAALLPIGDGLCPRVANLAQNAVDVVGNWDVHDTVLNFCYDKWPDLVDEIDNAIHDARIGDDVITLSGRATISGPNTLSPGTWDGRLLGSPFSGTFHSYR